MRALGHNGTGIQWADPVMKILFLDVNKAGGLYEYSNRQLFLLQNIQGKKYDTPMKLSSLCSSSFCLPVLEWSTITQR